MDSKEIKRIRKSLGLTQTEFAGLVGVSFQTVNRWEGGHFDPSGCPSFFIGALEKIIKEGSADILLNHMSGLIPASGYSYFKVFSMAYGE